jgi:glycosyltransferase involved in cell wall biosynthesis
MTRARVVVVRGHQATPWELKPWDLLPERFSTSYLRTRGNMFDPSGLELEPRDARTVRDRLPRGRIFDLAMTVAGDRYLGLEEVLADADVVHAEELSYWFAADVAKRRDSLGFKLVQTVWETLPMLDAYRNGPARKNRRAVLDNTDLYLAATERARDALLLEGAPAERIEVCPPGIDTARFAAAVESEPTPSEHVVLSAGRLVWEKGHHDVLRAVAAISRGVVGDVPTPRVLIVGKGPEEGRLKEHADDLGIGDRVEIVSLPYDEMPSAFARASCMVLASLPSAQGPLQPFGSPRLFWEEQFGMVIAEAMAASLDLLVSTSGAIPEVAGPGAAYFAPGDWPGIARLLAAGPLSRPPGARVTHDPELVERYSADAAAARLAAAYDRLLMST